MNRFATWRLRALLRSGRYLNLTVIGSFGGGWFAYRHDVHYTRNAVRSGVSNPEFT